MIETRAQSTDSANNEVDRGAFLAGIVLLLSTASVIFLMTHHPSPHSHSFTDMVDDFGAGTSSMSHNQMINVIVHGGAITIMGLFVFGFSWLSTCLGWNRTSVRLAMIGYTLGALGMVAAAMVSGFIVPLVLGRYVGATPAEMEMGIQILGLLRELNAAFDQLGVIAMSAGVLFWSIAMLGGQRRFLLVGIPGVLIGLAGIVGPASGHFAATVHGIIAFVLLQGIWNIAVAILMIRWGAKRKTTQLKS